MEPPGVNGGPVLTVALSGHGVLGAGPDRDGGAPIDICRAEATGEPWGFLPFRMV